MRLAVALALLVVSLAVGTALLMLAGEPPPQAMVQAELAGATFNYARAYARDGATGAGGFADRLSFIAAFPAFSPLAGKDRGVVPTMTVTLTPTEERLDPAERPAKLYARFLTPETFEGPGGLILRRFERNSPYDSEELFIAPPDGRRFFARCPKAASGAPGEACISVFRHGPFDVELRYMPNLLGEWETLYDLARAFIGRIAGTTHTKKR